MANEISISVSLQVSKLGVTNALSKTLNRDLTGTNQISNIQTVGLVAELVTIGGLANISHLCAINVGENPVSLSRESDGSSPFAELPAGGICYLPLPAGITQLYAIATTAPSDLAVLACES